MSLTREPLKHIARVVSYAQHRSRDIWERGIAPGCSLLGAVGTVAFRAVLGWRDHLERWMRAAPRGSGISNLQGKNENQPANARTNKPNVRSIHLIQQEFQS
jgi:hypothetical protein